MASELERIPGGCLLIIVPVGIALIAWALWMPAKIQSDVYRREGIEMSPFEIMMGAKPAERVIQIKEHGK